MAKHKQKTPLKPRARKRSRTAASSRKSAHGQRARVGRRRPRLAVAAKPLVVPAAPEDQQARTVKAQTAFLHEYAKRGITLHACQSAKVGRRTVYDWLEVDERFKMLYAEAQKDADDELEAEAHRRGVVGVLEPVYQGGEQVGMIRRYSDRLLELQLRAHKPDKYSNKVEHTGKGGGPIRTEHVPVALHDLSEEELALAEKLLARATSPPPQAAQDPHA